jgi:hypothetical protein
LTPYDGQLYQPPAPIATRRYALIDQPHGIVGRNVLNHFQILFDGPAKTWWRLTNFQANLVRP